MNVKRLFGLAVLLLMMVSAPGYAAVVTVISPNDMPSSAPKVTFEGLLPYPTTTLNYSEQGLYFPAIVGLGLPDGNHIYYGGYGAMVFPGPVTKVSWLESYDSLDSVRLYSDTDGQQLIGAFSIYIPLPYTTPEQFAAFRFHGFESDVPFRRAELFQAVLPVDTVFVDDLQFIPEPSAACMLLAGLGIMTWRRWPGAKQR